MDTNLEASMLTKIIRNTMMEFEEDFSVLSIIKHNNNILKNSAVCYFSLFPCLPIKEKRKLVVYNVVVMLCDTNKPLLNQQINNYLQTLNFNY